ncbi:MAG TPA: hypothetical protein VH253_02635 [Phycisphaerae bacterium]|nr:hypothetical protein [Phycisphaerae bacterium]
MNANDRSLMSAMALRAPRDRRELAAWVEAFLGMRMPMCGQCPGHHTPLDYLEHSFFERNTGGGDAVVWACRGGGKTMIGAAATLLDLLFKPGIQIRILGGSFEQSEKMYAYLRTLVERHFRGELKEAPTQRRLEFRNGSRVEVLAQSATSVRGQRVQKLRCDEVELFDPEVWQAAQLTTRSEGRTAEGLPVRGAVEAFSTMHRPGGLMQELLEDTRAAGAGEGAAGGRKVFAWCVWDVLEKCPERRKCEGCPLWDACGGRAKKIEGAGGFVKIDDVIAMQRRVSAATWEHEMLCERPRFEDAVFPEFRREAHVRAFPTGARPGARVEADGRALRLEAVVAGVDFGYRHAFVCLWVAMLRDGAGRRVAWVAEELVTRERTLARNVDAMRASAWGDAGTLVYCDNAGGQVNAQTGITDVRVLREAGFVPRHRFMEIHEGVAALAELLAPAAGEARLLIDPACERLIAAMEGYRRGKDGEPVKDKVHDHLIDALRYAVAGHDHVRAKLVVARY